MATPRKGSGMIPKFTCDLCDDNVNGRWFCEDCKQKLCEECGKRHKKSRATKHHVINPLNKLQTITQYEREAGMCEVHDSKRCEMYCTSCDMSICSKCCFEDHKGHDLSHIEQFSKKISSDFNKYLTEIGRIQNDFEQFGHQKCLVHEQTLQEFTSKEDEIKAYTSRMKKKLEELERLTLESVKSQRDKTKEKNKLFQKDYTTQKNILAQLKTDIEMEITKKNPNKSLRKSKRIKEQIKKFEESMCHDKDPLPSPIYFVAGKLEDSLTITEFGYFKHEGNDDIDGGQLDIKYDALSTFSLKSDPVRIICLLDNGQKAWIAYDCDRVLSLVDSGGENKMNRDAGDVLEDITIDAQENIFVCFNDETDSSQKIKKFDKKGRYKLFAEFRLDVQGLCTNGAEIFASFKYGHHGEVVRLSAKGEVIQGFSERADGSQLYVSPGRLAVLPDDELAVIDQVKENAEVKIVDRNGKMLLSWKGGNPKLESSFWPFDISHDSMGRILITDGDNSTIYILNKDRQSYKCLLDQGQVTAIAGSDADVIWVADMNGSIKVLKLKHEI